MPDLGVNRVSLLLDFRMMLAYFRIVEALPLMQQR